MVQQSQEEVTSESHQELLDEVRLLSLSCSSQIWTAVNISELESSSDTLSDFTLLDEKDYEKDVVDWVKVWSSKKLSNKKLGFQGKTPATDFRATGTALEFIYSQVKACWD